MKKFGSIDIGSNTVRLLVMEADDAGNFRKIDSEDDVVSLENFDLLTTGIKIQVIPVIGFRVSEFDTAVDAAMAHLDGLDSSDFFTADFQCIESGRNRFDSD